MTGVQIGTTIPVFDCCDVRRRFVCAASETLLKLEGNRDAHATRALARELRDLEAVAM
jgi:hypothetical protein